MECKNKCIQILINYDFVPKSTNCYSYFHIFNQVTNVFSDLLTTEDKLILQKSIEDKKLNNPLLRDFPFICFTLLYTENEISINENLKCHYKELISDYRESNLLITNLNWIYTVSDEEFVNKFNELIIYGSYLPNMNEISLNICTALNRILFKSSEYVNNIFQVIIETSTSKFCNHIYKNKDVIETLKMLKEKFSTNTPIYVDDLVFSKFISFVDTLLI